MAEPIIVEFPLRGEWISPNTPGAKVPSHGTTRFGESHAIDFVMVDEKGNYKKPYRKSVLEYLVRGLDLSDFHGWGQNVYAPLEGEVLEAIDGVPERNKANILNDLKYMLAVTKKFERGEGTLESIAGNYILLKCPNGVYALLAHLKRGSFSVKPGQAVAAGQVVGQLGHSGNSTMPHLHMQFMDSPDYRVAKGIPFIFREYEVRQGNGWKKAYRSIPTDKDVVRYP